MLKLAKCAMNAYQIGKKLAFRYPLVWGNECDAPKGASKGDGAERPLSSSDTLRERDREKALAAVCHEYHTKPIKMPRLLGKIKTLIQKVQ